MQQYDPIFYTFYESYFSRVRHPSHSGRRDESLTCHMTQFERSDWLRLASFINLIIEFLSDACLVCIWTQQPAANIVLFWKVCWSVNSSVDGPLTRYVKLRVAHALGMPETFSPPRLQRKPLVHEPGLHHGTCVTWCMSGSLTRGGGENVLGIHGVCAPRNFTNLTRGPFGRSLLEGVTSQWMTILIQSISSKAGINNVSLFQGKHSNARVFKKYNTQAHLQQRQCASL